MSYMFQAGFLGTKAPFFMDLVTLVVALLPLLVGIAISFARRKRYHLHGVLQITIFIVSVLIVSYFEYAVRSSGGYETFVQNTQVSHHYLLTVLIIHIVIAVVTLGIWANTLFHGRKDWKNGTLPGLYSPFHKKAGIRAYTGIVLTSLTGIWVYLLLFVF